MTDFVPKIGSRWVWEIDQPLGRTIIEVVDATWNGEEWWITTRSLPDAPTPMLAHPPREPQEHHNELSRFWEAVTPVGGATDDLVESASELLRKRELADAGAREAGSGGDPCV